MDLENTNIPGQVAVIFKTQLPAEFQAEELPITVETKFAPKDISEVLIELIKAKREEAGIESATQLEGTQFQFRVGQKLLRGSLKSHLIANQITAEETIELEYSFAPALPSLDSSN